VFVHTVLPLAGVCAQVIELVAPLEVRKELTPN
jgi:hypothetical protein